ncbi:DUF3667 domain-containing protein [Aurantiacibacter luteus]|uniref:DUF3667 domain-containing protein n=1 Tax=Aurantiacibacter luteus TaxID=1581420 RepID=A0A0G9MU00_9SPHN|nr:DUF3667 domain-containing protein [Aurantiacibacter luteus]KLE34059.1 hypothetical protein AAW00_07115 [Aurantiacibacter luteus]
MSDIFDGLGTAAEGGFFARALEPDSGALARGAHDPENCQNCGTPLVGAYCHACGQRGHLHKTIGAFMHDLLHGALHFEGKLWNTLPMLALRPGKLTRRYIDGERARFVSPMALFLFGVFAMFAAFSVAGIAAPSSFDGEDNSFVAGVRDGMEANDSAIGAAATSPAEGLAELRDQRGKLIDRLEAMSPGDPARAGVQEEIAGIDQAIAIVEIPGRLNAGDDATANGEAVEEPRPNDLDRLADAGTGIALVDRLMHKWQENPGLMLYKLQSSAYKFSWLLIPISIPFVWLLFAWRRRFGAYDHAIFVTYSLGFMTLMFIVLSLLGVAGIPGGVLALAAMIVAPIHLYKQLRGAYDLSRFSAFWRLLVLSAFIWIIVALFAQILLLLGAF